MDKEKKKRIMQWTSFDELLNVEYEYRVTKTRKSFEYEAKRFYLSAKREEEQVSSR